MLEIKNICLEDAEIYKKFQVEVHESKYLVPTSEEVNNKSIEDYRSIIHKSLNGLSNIILAKEEDKIVGAIWCGSNYASYAKSKTVGFGIAVLPSYRGRGIAQSLINKAEPWMIEKKFKKIYIAVVSENHNALQLYLKNGFKKEGLAEKSLYIGDDNYLDEILLSKILD